MDLCPLHSHFVIFFPVSEAPFMWVLLHACGVSIAILEDGALALAFSSRLCTPKMSDHPLQLSFRSIPRCDRASRAEPRATRSALYHVPGLVLQHLYSHPLRTRIPVVYGSSPVQADSSRNKEEGVTAGSFSPCPKESRCSRSVPRGSAAAIGS